MSQSATSVGLADASDFIIGCPLPDVFCKVHRLNHLHVQFLTLVIGKTEDKCLKAR